MPSPLRSAIAAVLLLGSAWAQAPGEAGSGWTTLFDGVDPAKHWRGYRKAEFPTGWQVEGGALVRKGKGGDIITREQYGSFELELEYRIGEAGNSGIMFHVQETDGKPWFTGPEFQILDNAKGKDPHKSGSMYSLYPPTKDTTKPVGEWNHVRLVVNAGRCEHYLNGEKVVEYQLGSPDWEAKVAQSKFAKLPLFAKAGKGHILLQDHGDEVAFRHMRIRVLEP